MHSELISIPTQQILALNDAESSENRIHSDDIAAKFGFTGALVSGVNVFGYLSQPLTRAYGEDWLNQGLLDVLFLKPAYQDDLLTVRTQSSSTDDGTRSHQTTAVNEHGTIIATLESWLPRELPAVNILAKSESPITGDERKEICWELIELHKPTASYLWEPSIADNLERVEVQRDQCDLYSGDDAYIHPYYLLDSCNKALMRMFILPAWIHTGSRLVIRKGLRVGQSIHIYCTPIDKWERRGHQFIKLYIALWSGNELAAEVEHTAIFKIAG